MPGPVKPVATVTLHRTWYPWVDKYPLTGEPYEKADPRRGAMVNITVSLEVEVKDGMYNEALNHASELTNQAFNRERVKQEQKLGVRLPEKE
jgi:hypothetical protein